MADVATEISQGHTSSQMASNANAQTNEPSIYLNWSRRN